MNFRSVTFRDPVALTYGKAPHLMHVDTEKHNASIESTTDGITILSAEGFVWVPSSNIVFCTMFEPKKTSKK